MTRSELMKVIEEAAVDAGMEEFDDFPGDLADRLEEQFGLIDEEDEEEEGD